MKSDGGDIERIVTTEASAKGERRSLGGVYPTKKQVREMIFKIEKLGNKVQ